MINNVIGKNKNKGSIIPYITVNGICKYDPSIIANEFRKFYSSIGSSLAQKIKVEEKGIDQYIQNIPQTVDSLALHATSPSEIETVIKAILNKTSYGHDKIGNVILKSLNEAISLPLCRISNQSIMEGRFPELVKLAKVVPLYKSKEMDIVINYRPISLLITISKVLEKIIYKRVYSFLERNSILYKSQYGFRTNHNCEQAIMELVLRLLHAKERDKHSAGIFLDLSKAFDTLNHTVLLSKLERLGIRGVMNKWFSDYLSGRSLVAKITVSENRVVYSEPYQITYGTAQGSCLGPLLFILFLMTSTICHYIVI